MSLNPPQAPARLEVHVTVEPRTDSPVSALAEFAERRGVDFLHIVLDSGQCPQQPMLSWRQSGDVEAALERSRALGQGLADVGWKLVRTKIELDTDVETPSEYAYCEAHFKIRVTTGKLSSLRRLAGELDAHLSRSAHSQDSHAEYRFLTVRERFLAEASERCHRIESILRKEGWEPVSTHREAVLYDSNLALDRGWSS